ncbi:MAG: hypothetical protein AAGD00_09705 [Planctomycetota bacterium]
MGIAKCIIRTGVIGALAAGGLVLVAGPDTVHTMWSQVRTGVGDAINEHIDDPVVLRSQLTRLEAQYPAKIADVRTELDSLRTQMSDLERDKAIADKVIELASADQSELTPRLAEAAEVRADSPYATIRVRFDGQSMPLEKAYGKATQLTNTINAYTQRSANAQSNLDYLAVQAGHLEGLLTDLEAEHAEFQAQLWQLESEIEMIARNDALLAMIEERQQSIDELNRFEAKSINHVRDRMARIRSEQESRFETLMNSPKETYEQQAQQMLDREANAREVFEKSQEAAVVNETIEIGSDEVEDASVAMREIVID